MENTVEKYKQKSRIRKIFGKYFLPFSIAEILFIFPLFLLLGVVVFVYFYLKPKGITFFPALPTFFSALLIFIIILGYFYKRFFIEIKSGLSFADNLKIIQEIVNRQEIVYESLEMPSFYMFKLPVNNKYFAIFCKDNVIYINSFSPTDSLVRRLYNKDLNQLERLIRQKVNSIKKSIT